MVRFEHVRPFSTSTESQESKSDIVLLNKTWHCALGLRKKIIYMTLSTNNCTGVKVSEGQPGQPIPPLEQKE